MILPQQSQQTKTRILIVDDSSFMRMTIRSTLSREPSYEVVGTAADGMEGVEKALVLKPDLITMAVKMPRLDGVAALKQIMAKAPTRVIMVAMVTNEGAEPATEALNAGAVAYILNNIADAVDGQNTFRQELLGKIRVAIASQTRQSAVGTPSVNIPKIPTTAGPLQPAAKKSDVMPATPAFSGFPRPASAKPSGKKIQYVGIGASTGGPLALQEILLDIPANFPFGIMVCMHMPKAFTGAYAERLNSKCPLTIREAVDGDILKPGLVLVAPGGMHTTLARQGSDIVVRTLPTSSYPQYVYIPSIDLMLSSMAEATNGAMLGVILTGMGTDGFKGMQLLKQKGGVTIAQDEATSTIYGMPKACVIGGVADEILPLGKIGFEITKFM